MTTEYVESLRRPDPQFLQRFEHPLRRLQLDDKRLSGLQQALQAGQDRGPALTAARENVVVDRPIVGLGQREPNGLGRWLDFVGHERRAELLDQRRPIDVPGNGEPARRVACDHFAADMNRTVRRAGDERAADLQLDLHREAGKILSGELGRGQRLPDLFRRGGDVDGVDDGGFEVVDVHGYSNPSMLGAEGGIASAVPDSSRLFRLDGIAGHPLEMPSRITLPSSKSSCVGVSFTSLPCGSRLRTTLVGRSLRAASLSTWWNV